MTIISLESARSRRRPACPFPTRPMRVPLSHRCGNPIRHPAPSHTADTPFSFGVIVALVLGIGLWAAIGFAVYQTIEALS